MALRKPFVYNAEGFHEEIAVADTLDVGSIEINASGSGIDMNSKKITELGDGTAAGDVLNKAQIDLLVSTGNVFKEPVHSSEQLIDGASGGIRALEVLHFEAQPVAVDYVVLRNATLTRQYDFVANIGAESAATDVSIETDAATAMQRLVLRVNADVSNTQWELFYHESGETGDEIHVTLSTTPADTLSDSRIYGVWATQANVTVIPFSDGVTAIQYNVGTEAAMPVADTTTGRFGFSRLLATLVDGEVHLALDVNAQYSWEETAQTWNQISGAGAIPDATSGSGGGTKGLVHLDSDKGLTIASDGLAEVSLEANKGMQFESGGGLGIKIASANELSVDSSGLNVVGVPAQFELGGTAVSSAVSAANLGTLTAGVSSDADSLHTHDGFSDSGHTHSHASTTGQGVNDHHNQSHVLDGGDHTVSGLTTGHVLQATGATTFAFGAAGAAPEAAKVENTVNTATDTTANGDPVYVNANDTYGKARADTDAKARTIGIIRTGGGAAPTAVEVVTAGIATSVLAGGGTANTPYYLQATGGVATALPGAGNRVICMGYALNANDLWVRVTDYGKKAA